jgi:hypothetical protein
VDDVFESKIVPAGGRDCVNVLLKDESKIEAIEQVE